MHRDSDAGFDALRRRCGGRVCWKIYVPLDGSRIPCCRHQATMISAWHGFPKAQRRASRDGDRSATHTSCSRMRIRQNEHTLADQQIFVARLVCRTIQSVRWRWENSIRPDTSHVTKLHNARCLITVATSRSRRADIGSWYSDRKGTRVQHEYGTVM